MGEARRRKLSGDETSQKPKRATGKTVRRSLMYMPSFLHFAMLSFMQHAMRSFVRRK
jgi:hypothetical protein